jgi:SAM-dependent methyltransferase
MVERIMDPNNIRPDHLERYNFACKKLEELTEPDHVLDIGCGIGYGSVIMQNMMSSWVDCIDKSKEAHEVFLKSYDGKAPRVNYILQDFTKLKKGLLRDRYDAVVSFEFIEHIPPDLAQSVFDLAGEKTNLFICSSPNERVRPHQLPPVNEFHYKHYTPEEFEAMGRQAGFTDVDFFCQTSGKHYDVRPGLEGGKFMIAVFSKGVMGTLDFKTRGPILHKENVV